MDGKDEYLLQVLFFLPRINYKYYMKQRKPRFYGGIYMATFIFTVLFILLVAAVLVLFALIGFIAVITHTVLRIKDLIEDRRTARKIAEIQKKVEEKIAE